MEYGQEAQGGQHVAGALLQDELVHVEERVLVLLLLLLGRAPAVSIVRALLAFTGDLRGTEATPGSRRVGSVCLISSRILMVYRLSSMRNDTNLSFCF